MTDETTTTGARAAGTTDGVPLATIEALGEQTGRLLGGVLAAVGGGLERLMAGAGRIAPDGAAPRASTTGEAGRAEHGGAATARAAVIVHDVGQRAASLGQAARWRAARAAARAREELEDVWAEAQVVRDDLARRAAGARDQQATGAPPSSGGAPSADAAGDDVVIVDGPAS